jgi:tellurite resistance protein TerC
VEQLNQTSLWIVFAVVVLGFLGLDLFVLNRKAKTIGFRAALKWTAFWAGLAMVFAAGIFATLGTQPAVTFLTAYVVEQSLSVDNLFVILLIFSSFKVPAQLQHRVLFWGIIGALVLRAICIGVGVVALARFQWLSYVFGLILVVGGIKTAFDDDDEESLDDSRIVRMLKKIIPVSKDFDGEKFITLQNGRRLATPLLLALVVVEISDLVFAVDSIPAVLAITQDPFLVYTSNVFAILGLRSIFFALAHMMRLFRYLKYALAVILVFVGVKIGLQHHVTIPEMVTLPIIVALLALAVVASVVIKEPAEGAG